MSGVSSLYEQQVLYAPADVAVSDPVDTWTAHTMINNALHMADTSGQVLVADVVQLGQNGPGGSSDSEDRGGIPIASWGRLALFGPFTCRVGSDGIPYPQRARLAFKSSGTGTVQVRLVVATLPELQTDAVANGANTIGATAASNLASAWLASGIITHSTTTALQAQTTQPSLHTLGGATTVDVRTCELYAGVFVNAAGNTDMWVQGCYLAEWVGL